MAKKKKSKEKKPKDVEAKPLLVVAPILPDIQLPSPKTQTLLFTVATGEMDSLSRLVGHYDHSSSLNTTDLNGSNPLHVATRAGNIEIVKKLLTYRNVPVDSTESASVGGYSALHIACKMEFFGIVQVLLDAGADPNLKSQSSLGETPLHVCCKNGSLVSARLLLVAGANPDARDSFGHNPSFWASSKTNGSMIKDLALPPVHKATAEEHLAMILQKNPKFVLVAKKPKAKKGDKKKGDKKKGKK